MSLFTIDTRLLRRIFKNNRALRRALKFLLQRHPLAYGLILVGYLNDRLMHKGSDVVVSLELLILSTFSVEMFHHRGQTSKSLFLFFIAGIPFTS